MNKIELSDKDAEKFKEFLKYYDLLHSILVSYAEMRDKKLSGQIEIHVKPDGKIHGVKIDRWLYIER